MSNVLSINKVTSLEAYRRGVWWQSLDGQVRLSIGGYRHCIFQCDLAMETPPLICGSPMYYKKSCSWVLRCASQTHYVPPTCTTKAPTKKHAVYDNLEVGPTYAYLKGRAAEYAHCKVTTTANAAHLHPRSLGFYNRHAYGHTPLIVCVYP